MKHSPDQESIHTAKHLLQIAAGSVTWVDMHNNAGTLTT